MKQINSIPQSELTSFTLTIDGNYIFPERYVVYVKPSDAELVEQFEKEIVELEKEVEPSQEELIEMGKSMHPYYMNRFRVEELQKVVVTLKAVAEPIEIKK